MNNHKINRLYYFLKGFIKSPFVLTDLEAELSFRNQLAELYSRLVPRPGIKNKSSAKLISLVKVNFKKKKEKMTLDNLLIY